MNRGLKNFIIIISIFLSVLLSFGSVRAAESEEQEKVKTQEIPEYFLAPEGPFKDKEAYEKALVAQNDRGWRGVNFPINYAHILYNACQEDLKMSNDDIQKFLPTKCGLLIQGYVDASEIMFYTLTGGVEKALRLTVAKQKPFCVTNDINIMDVAKIFVSYVKSNPRRIDTIDKDRKSGGWLIFLAMNDKYPCPRYFEEENR